MRKKATKFLPFLQLAECLICDLLSVLVKKWHFRNICDVQSLHGPLIKAIKLFHLHYYSFKIFPWFGLAKSTCIIHHNQLLMTKFGRILCLPRKWCQKCSLLQVNEPLTEKTWGRGWVVLVVKTKMADTSLVSRVRTTAGTRRSNS